MKGGTLRAVPAKQAVAYLAKHWNLTEEMAQQRLAPARPRMPFPGAESALRRVRCGWVALFPPGVPPAGAPRQLARGLYRDVKPTRFGRVFREKGTEKVHVWYIGTP
jgi:hypothetical protein